MAKSCLIFNAAAGSAGDIGHVLHQFVDMFRGDILTSEGADQTREVAQKAVEQGYERIVVAGGDGTIHQVVNGIAPRFAEVELAILPLGTGNDLARSLGIPVDNVTTALTVAFEGQIVPADVGIVRGSTEFYFLNAASGGAGGGREGR